MSSALFLINLMTQGIQDTLLDPYYIGMFKNHFLLQGRNFISLYLA